MHPQTAQREQELDELNELILAQGSDPDLGDEDALEQIPQTTQEWAVWIGEQLPVYLGLIALAIGYFFGMRELKINRLTALLAAEDSLAAARERYADAGLQLSVRNAKLKRVKQLLLTGKGDQLDMLIVVEESRFANRYHEEAYVQFLNRLDRICACVLRGQIEKDHARQDYKDMVIDLCQENGEIVTSGRYESIARCFYTWFVDEGD